MAVKNGDGCVCEKGTKIREKKKEEGIKKKEKKKKEVGNQARGERKRK